VEQVLEAARREREAGLREVARQRVELAPEAAAMEQLQAAQRSRIELEVGGARFVTSVVLLSRADGRPRGGTSGRRHRNWPLLSSVDRYDRRHDTWTAAAPMLEAGSWFGLCVLSGEVYVAGGLSRQYNSRATVLRCRSPDNGTVLVQSANACT
jgi:hypothetical protein